MHRARFSQANDGLKFLDRAPLPFPKRGMPPLRVVLLSQGKMVNAKILGQTLFDLEKRKFRQGLRRAPDVKRNLVHMKSNLCYNRHTSYER